jgi:uncharacterized membrane protein
MLVESEDSRGLCTILLNVHKVTSIPYSTSPYLNRPMRMFRVIAELFLYLFIIGTVLHSENKKDDGIIAVAVAFLCLRGFSLMTELLIRVPIKSAQYIVGVFFFGVLIAGHVLTIHLSSEMTNEDFDQWGLAFFLATMMELVVWELVSLLAQILILKSKSLTLSRFVNPRVKKHFI